MSVFARLATFLRVGDDDESSDDFNEGPSRATADLKRLEKRVRQEAELAVEWEKKAMLAVKAANDALAQQALLRKLEHLLLGIDCERQVRGTGSTSSSRRIRCATQRLRLRC